MTSRVRHHEVVIRLGEFYFGTGDVRIVTLLGSCVSITLWHPAHRHGGMCHYMLDSRGVILDHLDGRFADEAMELFMLELSRCRTRPAEYQVKVFGGGALLGKMETSEGIQAVGEINVAAARHLLNRHGFRIHSEHVGGRGFRNVMFDLWSGAVWMKFRNHIALDGRKL